MFGRNRFSLNEVQWQVGEIPDIEGRRGTLRFPNGSTYRLSVADGGGVQKAHYHKGLDELYFVQLGQIDIFLLLADSNGGDADMKVHTLDSSNEPLLIPAGVVHNVRVSPGAVFHVIERGNPVANQEKKDDDWWPAQSVPADWPFEE